MCLADLDKLASVPLFFGDIVKNIIAAIVMSLLLLGCASHDIRNWNPEAGVGQIVVYTGEGDRMFKPVNEQDALEALENSGKCPDGYIIVKDRGWQGGGWVTKAGPSEDKVSTKSSLSVGGKEIYSVEKSEGSKSGKETVVKVGDYQTEKLPDGNYTVVRSPEPTPTPSGEMRGKWYDFKCK